MVGSWIGFERRSRGVSSTSCCQVGYLEAASDGLQPTSDGLHPTSDRGWSYPYLFDAVMNVLLCVGHIIWFILGDMKNKSIAFFSSRHVSLFREERVGTNH